MIMTIPGDNDTERMIVLETETEHSQQTFQMSRGEGSSAVMVFKLYLCGESELNLSGACDPGML